MVIGETLTLTPSPRASRAGWRAWRGLRPCDTGASVLLPENRTLLAHLPSMKREGSQGAHVAAGLAFFAPGDAERALGAGDAHIHQASLLLDLVFVDGGLVRQDALLHANQEDVLELEPLEACRVAICTPSKSSLSLSSMLIRLMVWVSSSRFCCPPRPSPQPADEIADVAPLALSFARIARVVQPGLVADGAEQIGEHLRGRLAWRTIGEPVDEVAELATDASWRALRCCAAPSSKAAPNRLRWRCPA